jgi:Domain of unknown function (DUF932)
MEQKETHHRRVVDLASHLNETVERGHPADFPIVTHPVYYGKDGAYEPIPHRLAIVRADTGQTLSVVSDRYTLVPHQRVLDVVEQAIRPLDPGPVPRGIYVDRQGARMRALFKFPALAQPVLDGDDICPCLKIQNTYDGTSRIAIHIGAFRFVCTNLAVGGGGVFAGGFMSIHAGEIPLEEFANQTSTYLGSFEKIVGTYRQWSQEWLEWGSMAKVLEGISKRHASRIGEAFATRKPTVYEAYNAATFYATHKTRSYRIAFDLLERINRGFQKHFPPASESTPEPQAVAPVHTGTNESHAAHAAA